MKSGDKVICINVNTPQNQYDAKTLFIKENAIYTVDEIINCSKCNQKYIRLKEIQDVHVMLCPICEEYEETILYFSIDRFLTVHEYVELHENDEDNDVLKELDEYVCSDVATKSINLLDLGIISLN